MAAPVGMNTDLADIEHANAEYVAILGRPGANDLGEERDADAHEVPGPARLELGKPLGLLGAERWSNPRLP